MKDKVLNILAQLFSTVAICSTFKTILDVLNFFSINDWLGYFYSFFCCILFLLVMALFFITINYFTKEKDIEIKKLKKELNKYITKD